MCDICLDDEGIVKRKKCIICNKKLYGCERHFDELEKCLKCWEGISSLLDLGNEQYNPVNCFTRRPISDINLADSSDKNLLEYYLRELDELERHS